MTVKHLIVFFTILLQLAILNAQSQKQSFTTCSASKSLLTYLSFNSDTTFTKGSDTAVRDLTYNGYDGLLKNSASLTSGACKESAQFPSAASGVLITANTNLMPRTEWSVEFWFNGVQPSTTTETIVDLFNSDIKIEANQNGRLSILIGGTNLLANNVNTYFTTTGTWRSFKLTKSGTTFTTTIDRTDVTTVNLAYTFNTFGPIVIGNNFAMNNKFNGRVDEFKIWACSNPVDSVTACPDCSLVNFCGTNGVCAAQQECLCNFGYSGRSCEISNSETCSGENLKAYYSFASSSVTTTPSSVQDQSYQFLDIDTSSLDVSKVILSNNLCTEAFSPNGTGAALIPFHGKILPHSYSAIEFWFKIPTPISGSKTLLYMFDTPNIHIFAHSSTKVSINVTINGVTTDLASSFNANYHDGTWHKVMIQKSLNLIETSIDVSTSQAFLTWPSHTVSQTTGVIIGKDNQNAGTQLFNGDIDELKFWSCSNLTMVESDTNACPACTNSCGKGRCVGKNVCSCEPGYFGSQCQNFACSGRLPSDSAVCSGNGVCTGPNTCQCNQGWLGQDCQRRSVTSCPSGFFNPPNCLQRFDNFVFSNTLSSLTTTTSLTSLPNGCATIFPTSSNTTALSPSSCSLSGTTLTVQLSGSSIVLPGDSVQVNILGIAGTQIVPIAILPAVAPQSPTVQISGSPIIGSCDSLSLTAVTSNPDRRSVTYRWRVTSSVDVTQIQASLDTQTSSTITILPALLQSATYSFFVNATNFLKLQGSASFSVVRSGNPAILLDVDPITQTVTSQTSLTISSRISFSSCYPENKARIILWTQVSGPTVTLPVVNQPSLFIPAGNFPTAGQNYRFRITISPALFPNDVVTKDIDVFVNTLPVIAGISGLGRTVASGTPFILQSTSSDPDKTSGTEQFIWGCSISGSTCSGVTFTNSATQNLTFASEGNYTISLTYAKGARNNTFSGWIQIIFSTVQLPTVNIEGDSRRVVDTTNRVSLTSTATRFEGEVYDFIWTQTSGPSIDLSSSTLVLTSSRSRILTFAPNALQAGATYIFRVSAQLRTNIAVASQAFVTVVGNTPPIAGTTTPSSSTATELTTRVSISCDKFGDGVQSLEYKIAQVDADGKEISTLKDWNGVSSVPQLLFAKQTEGFARVRCFARDTIGSTSFSESRVTVTPGVTSTDPQATFNFVNSKLSILDTAKESGNPEEILRIAQAAVSSLTVPPSTTPRVTLCPNDCSSNGNCTLVTGSTSLYACRCLGDRAGDDCSYTRALFQQMVELRSKIATAIVDAINTNTGITPTASTISQNTNALLALASKPSDLSPTAQTAIINAISTITSQGAKLALPPSTAENLLSTSASIFNAQLSNTNTTSTSDMLNDFEFDVQQTTTNMLSISTNVVKGLNNYKVLGESDTVIKTSSVTVVAAKRDPLALQSTSTQVGSGSDKVNIPTTFLPTTYSSSSSEVRFAVQSFAYNPVGGSGAENLTSNTFEFTAYDTNNNPISVSNLTVPYQFTITASQSKWTSTINNNRTTPGVSPTCQWYNTVSRNWTSTGCKVVEYSYTGNLTANNATFYFSCQCTHTTLFGGFLNWVVPAPVDTPVYWDYTTLVTTLTTSAIYLVGFIFFIVYDFVEDKMKEKEDPVQGGTMRWIFEEIKKTHLWLSLFFKLNNNSFTRPQRWTVIFMTTIAIYAGSGAIYGQQLNGSVPSVHFVVGAFISILFALPFTVFFSMIFTYTAPRDFKQAAPKFSAMKATHATTFANDDFAKEDLEHQEKELEEKKEGDEKETKEGEDDATEKDQEPEPPKKKENVTTITIDESDGVITGIIRSFLDWGDQIFIKIKQEDNCGGYSQKLRLLGLFFTYSIVYALIIVFYSLLLALVLKVPGYALTIYICASVLFYFAAILYQFINLRVHKFISGWITNWYEPPSENLVPTLQAGLAVCLGLTFTIIGIILIIVGAVVPVYELIVIGVTFIIATLFLGIWLITIFVNPAKIFCVQPTKDKNTNSEFVFWFPWWTQFFTYGAIYALCILIIVLLIVFGLNYNYTLSQPNYWLGSALIGILFEIFLTKPVLIMMDLFGLGSIRSLINLIFFEIEKEEEKPKIKKKPISRITPKDKEEDKKVQTLPPTNAIKQVVNETFETEFGNEELGIIAEGVEDKEEMKLEIEDTAPQKQEETKQEESTPDAPPQEEKKVEPKVNEVEEEEAVEKPQEVKANEEEESDQEKEEVKPSN